jgi:hypothetical protein
MPVAGGEPKPSVVVLHPEHAEAADRHDYDVHRDNEPPAKRLVLIGKAQDRSDFRRAQLQSAALKIRRRY